MTLRHMRIFVAVCTHNSITKAADALFLAQPTVSLAIKEMEEYYGVSLFNRISHKLYLSETGRLFLSYATHIIELFDELDAKIKNWDTLGTLRIGASITTGTYLLPGLVSEFHKSHPQIKVQAAIKNSEELEKLIMLNDLDFALIEGEIHNSQIRSEKIMEDKLTLICGANHPMAGIDSTDIRQLASYDFILREKGSGTREFFDSTLMVHNLTIKPIWESVSTHAILNAVSCGLGLSVLPHIMVKPYLDTGRVKEIKINDADLVRPFYVIYHCNKFLSNSAKDFMALCKFPVEIL
ncbi:LysR family transcriptional regulator [Anaerocolumna xylanovorans]|uniref:DNA-binding transcriptional regulator, LysR family n=1 Tax=Anaerocolumna xylanovorans DSM 12503 TaxID=1121345 RepID=A0A1M7YNN5_9FIRM|nr:LysR family transcriptional regulator [Anaerocolumna xylanovorans]SHO54230.1 DNA-binding transcriptional regulator, LysR family [Anaerocolumna xylanovorans DSM 12503]